MKNANFFFLAILIIGLSVFMQSCEDGVYTFNGDIDDIEFPDGTELSDIFDCPQTLSNFGEDCFVNNELGEINTDCECEQLPFACPELEANVGSICFVEVSGELPAPGFINENCECDLFEYDCPELYANYGLPCVLSEGVLGTVNENCECE